MKKFIIKNTGEMINLAQHMAVGAKPGDIFGLKGSLGAGKSFFARAFINALTSQETSVASPTFNLVYSYASKKGEIFHFDLYRLKSADELENIGFFDALKSGICLIEWPEIAQKFLTKNYTEIEIKFVDGQSEEERLVLLKD